jgi:hypothetical protein
MKTLKGLDDAYGIAFTKNGDFYAANVALARSRSTAATGS